MEESKKIKVVMVEPGKEAYATEIDTGLESLQKAVGGFIECFYPYDDCIIVCNEEGKLDGSKPCRAIRDEDGKVIEIIYGRFFICGESDCELASLPDDLIEKYLTMFEKAEIFIPLGNVIYVRPE